MFLKELRDARTRIFLLSMLFKGEHGGSYKIHEILDFPFWSLNSSIKTSEGLMLFFRRSNGWLTDNPFAKPNEKGVRLVFLNKVFEKKRHTQWLKGLDKQTTFPHLRPFRYWNNHIIADAGGEGLVLIPIKKGTGEPFVLSAPSTPLSLVTTGSQKALISFGQRGLYTLNLATKTLQPSNTK